MSNNETRILVVDDEPDILNLLDYNLKKAGYKVLLAKDGPEAIDIAVRKTPDLIILDIMLPDMEGTEVLRRLKGAEITRRIPVIMLTAKGEEIDRIIGFELGAEDYITKPFSPRELILRVKAVLKRAETHSLVSDETLLSFKELTVDPTRHKVSVGGRDVTLSSQEFKLLTALLTANGKVLTRDMILDRAWGHGCNVVDRTVDTHMRRLRIKLKDAGRYLQTIRGVGYKFDGETR